MKINIFLVTFIIDLRKILKKDDLIKIVQAAFEREYLLTDKNRTLANNYPFA